MAARRQVHFAAVFSFDPQPDPHRQNRRQPGGNFGVKNASFEKKISLTTCGRTKRLQVRDRPDVQIEKMVEMEYNWITVGLVPAMPAVRYSRAAFAFLIGLLIYVKEDVICTRMINWSY